MRTSPWWLLPLLAVSCTHRLPDPAQSSWLVAGATAHAPTPWCRYAADEVTFGPPVGPPAYPGCDAALVRVEAASGYPATAGHPPRVLARVLRPLLGELAEGELVAATLASPLPSEWCGTGAEERAAKHALRPLRTPPPGTELLILGTRQARTRVLVGSAFPHGDPAAAKVLEELKLAAGSRSTDHRAARQRHALEELEESLSQLATSDPPEVLVAALRAEPAWPERVRLVELVATRIAAQSEAEVARAFLEAVGPRSPQARLALSRACERADRPAIQVFLKAGTPLSPLEGDLGPLVSAIAASRCDVAGDLLAAGAGPGEPNQDGVTPLRAALGRRLPACVSALLQAGARAAGPEGPSFALREEVTFATRGGDLALLELLLDHDPSLDQAPGLQGLLSMAAPNPRVVELLRRHGAR